LLDGSGTTALTKTGSGTLLLSGTDSYHGETTVLSGKLIAGNVGVLPDDGNLTVGSASYFAPVVPAVSAAVAVPEPGTLALIAVTGIGLLGYVWPRRRAWARSTITAW
jgi:autotransporter-associated beta strand protein